VCDGEENVFSSFFSFSEYELCAVLLIKIVRFLRRSGYIMFMKQGYINVTLVTKSHHFNYTKVGIYN
jgi:hypothetical protein